MIQDYLYLIDYAKLFAIGAMKATDLQTMGKFAALLDSTLNEEMSLHREYAKKFEISEKELEKRSHLLQRLHTRTICCTLVKVEH